MSRRRAALWLLVLVAGIAATLAGLLQGRGASEHEGDSEARLEALWPVPLEETASVEIVVKTRLHRFERDAAGAWYHHSHSHETGAAAHAHVAPVAEAGRIAAALEMASRTRIERRIAYDPAQRAAYGLRYPVLILMIYGKDRRRPLLILEAGDVAPDTVSRYASLGENGALAVIPDYQIRNLLDLVAGFETGT